MLFYQRASALHAQQKQEIAINITPKELVTLELANHIALDNELLLRKYCLFDESQALFVKSAFEMQRQFYKGVCSLDHSIERSAIDMGMSYMDQVMSHTKDIPDFGEMVDLIMGRVRSCARCCKILLEWFVSKPDVMRTLLLRAPAAKVRTEICKMIMGTLQLLRTMDPSLYGLDLIRERQTGTETTTPFTDILFVLHGFWEVIDLHLRAWDEYFGILAQLTALGEPERMLVLLCGYLRRCLELLLADFDPQLRHEYERLLRAIGKGRKATYKSLTELLKELLAPIDLTLKDRPHDEDDRYRASDTDHIPLTRGEDTLMRMVYPRQRSIVWLTRLLDHNHNQGATMHIIAQLVQAEPEYDQLGLLCRTLIRGITYEPSSQAEPYLQAALAVCEYAPTPTDCRELILRTSKEVDTIGNNGGREHLHFFRTLAWLKNERWPQYPHLHRKRVIDFCHFWSPPLLLYWDQEVREGTETLLHQILFEYGAPPAADSPETNALMEHAGKLLGWACINKLTERYTEKNQQVERRVLESIVRVLGECLAYFAEHEARDEFVARRDGQSCPLCFSPSFPPLLCPRGIPICSSILTNSWCSTEVLGQMNELVIEEGEEAGSGASITKVSPSDPVIHD